MTSGANGQQKRCIELISKDSCLLPACRKTCYLKYPNKNGFGQCVSANPFTPYSCICAYDCQT